MDRVFIINAIRQTLQNNLAELETAMNHYQSASNLDETDTLDPDDFARQTEEKDMQMRMQVQIDQTRHQLIRLEELSEKEHQIAESGAIVQTNGSMYFLGVSFAAVSHQGKDLIGLSPESPAFMGIRGKRKGETAMIGGKEVEITAIT